MSLPRLDHDPRKGRDPPTSALIEWVELLGCWCVFDVTVITSILKSTNFVAADFAEQYRDAERKLGIDCSALVHALHYIATANEGRRHAEIRKDLARLISSNAEYAKAQVAKTARETVGKAGLPGARVDVMEEIVSPVCAALLEALLGTRVPPSPAGASPSQIFDLYLGLNRRKEVNAKTCAMQKAFAASQDRLKTSPDYAVALSLLGSDSILGSLGGSLLHVLRSAEGKRLCDVDFPSSLPVTGVPYVERFANSDCLVENVHIGKGDRIRLYLDAGSSEDASGATRPYFGRGRHSCLGEELSLAAWQAVTTELSRLPLTCKVENAVRRHPDWVFVYYSSIKVRFDA